jgi:acyl-CoA synthetase (NDP forming)
MPDQSLVDLFLRPPSVAIIGASQDSAKIGGRPLRYCIEAGYPGEIYPVNPQHALVQGLPAYASVRDVVVAPALAIIAVPRGAVMPALEDCIAAGVGAVVILSAGFAELDEEGQRLQAEIVERAAEGGVRIIGPNSNGVFNTGEGFFGLFSPVLDRGRPDTGRTAVVTQSAAVGTSLLDLMRREGFGLRYWAHVGNEADVSLVELARDLVMDDGIDTIVLAFESLRRADLLPELLTVAEKFGTRVIAFQTGFSSSARAAAASHTGALTVTSPALVRDILIQSGAVVATTFRDTVRALTPTVGQRGDEPSRVAVLTSSGGFGVLTADVLASAGALMPTLSEGLQQELLRIAPYCHPVNPVDTTAQIINQPGAYGRVGAALAGSGEVNVLVTFLPHPGLHDNLTLELIEVARAAPEGCAFVAIGPMDGETSLELRRHGIGVGSEPADLMELLPAGHLVPDDGAVEEPPDRSGVVEAERALRAENGIVGELDAKRALTSLGVPVVLDVEVHTVEQAVAAAATVGGPVAIKLHAAGVAHKAALGGVRLGLADQAQVAEAASQILGLELADVAGRGATLLVEPMVDGIEAFLGVSRSPDFGTVAVVGLGGTDVESSAQVGYAKLPVRALDVHRMLERSGLLAQIGLRHQDLVARQVLEILRSLGDWFADGQSSLHAVDINPLMVTDDGTCVAVDALIEVDPARGRTTEPEGPVS